MRKTYIITVMVKIQTGNINIDTKDCITFPKSCSGIIRTETMKYRNSFCFEKTEPTSISYPTTPFGLSGS